MKTKKINPMLIAPVKRENMAMVTTDANAIAPSGGFWNWLTPGDRRDGWPPI
jgi:prenylated cyclic peptide (anacyclamide/piricyclamide family)